MLAQKAEFLLSCTHCILALLMYDYTAVIWDYQWSVLHYVKVNINRKSATQFHLQLHDQVVVCPTLIEVLQSHHVVVLYPETGRNRRITRSL